MAILDGSLSIDRRVGTWNRGQSALFRVNAMSVIRVKRALRPRVFLWTPTTNALSICNAIDGAWLNSGEGAEVSGGG